MHCDQCLGCYMTCSMFDGDLEGSPLLCTAGWKGFDGPSAKHLPVTGKVCFKGGQLQVGPVPPTADFVHFFLGSRFTFKISIQSRGDGEEDNGAFREQLSQQHLT